MTADFWNRGKEYISMLESSKYSVREKRLDAHALKLPDVTEEDTSAAKSMSQDISDSCEKSTPEYYQAVVETLSANKAVLLYLYDNFDIFGRYGNKQQRMSFHRKISSLAEISARILPAQMLLSWLHAAQKAHGW